MRLFSTEAVSKYHPDKYADQISDAILTECLKQDRQSHCGIETMVKGNTVVLGGEITSKADINYDQIVRRVAKKLGYRADKIINLISEQSPEINRAVLSDEDIGAGDQGIMFGYATRETASRLPYAFDVANRIIAALEDDADNNPDTILKGDAKTQVTIDLDTGEIVTVVVSVCHKEECDLDEVQHYVLSLVGDECVCDDWIINPAGTWDRVQALFQKKVTFRNNAMGIPYLFSGLLECADCGCRLKGVRDSRRKASDPSQLWSAYKCGTYSNGGVGACTTHYITEEALIELLKQDIQIHAEQILLDEEKVRRDLLSRKTQEIDYEGVAKRQRLKDTSKRMAELDQIIENLYEDRVTRKIPEEVFDRFFGRYENERKSLVAELDEVNREVEDLEKTEFNIQHWIDLIKKYAAFEELDRPLLMALIDKIVVGDTHIEDGEKIRDIRIVYNFIGEVDNQ